MMCFLMLLTVDVFAEEIAIVAKVNQIPITTFDIENYIGILSVIMPNFDKYSQQEKQQVALQSLIQDALRQEYISKTGFKISKDEEKKYRKTVINMLAGQKIPNFDKFAKDHEDFIASQVAWQAVMEKSFMASVNVTDEMVQSVKSGAGAKFTEKQIREILIQKQLEAYSGQAVESIRKVSVIDVVS